MDPANPQHRQLDTPLTELSDRLERILENAHPDEWISSGSKASVLQRRLFAAGYAATSNVMASSRVAGFRKPRYELLDDPYVAQLVQQEMYARVARVRVTGDRILCDVLEGLDTALARRDTFVVENNTLLGVGSVAIRKHDLGAAVRFLDQLGKYKRMWTDNDGHHGTTPALILNLGGPPPEVPTLEQVPEDAFALALGPPDTGDAPDEADWEEEEEDDPWEDDDDWLR